MFGVKTTKGWLRPTTGPTNTFFVFDPQPHFPFRTREGAHQVALDWLARIGVEHEVHEHRSHQGGAA
jgi:hypothetical protein